MTYDSPSARILKDGIARMKERQAAPETFKSPDGTSAIEIRQMWGEYRFVFLFATRSVFGKSSFPTYQAARAELIANSTRV